MSKKKSHSIRRSTLDLEKRHFSRMKHGFEVIGTWYRDPDTHWQWKPCLVLLPEVWPASYRPVPCIIPLTEAWRWAMEGEIGDPLHVLKVTAEFFETNTLPGTAFNKRDHMRLLNAVNDNLRDLIAMPPRPPGDQIVIGDVTITKSSGEIINREITNDV